MCLKASSASKDSNLFKLWSPGMNVATTKGLNFHMVIKRQTYFKIFCSKTETTKGYRFLTYEQVVKYFQTRSTVTSRSPDILYLIIQLFLVRVIMAIVAHVRLMGLGLLFILSLKRILFEHCIIPQCRYIVTVFYLFVWIIRPRCIRNHILFQVFPEVTLV